MLTFCFFLNITFSFCYTIEPIPPKPDRELLGTYFTTRYYAPIPGQDSYFSGSYDKDYKMNCGGDCLITANGYRLKASDEYKVFACPKDLALGSRLFIEGIGEGICQDRGGSIKNKRIDVWVGIGEQGMENLRSKRANDTLRNVYIINR